MKNIIDNFYYEDSSGFTYEKKTFNGACYYVPLNFCILENKQIIDKTNYGKHSSKTETVQKHGRHLK